MRAADTKTYATFPDAGRISVPPALARELLRGAERLPHYDNREFYDTALQASVLGRVRSACPGGFDDLVGLVKERIRRRPYCVLLRGLRFDEGNRLFVALNRGFGELVALPYEKPRAQLVHYVQPSTDLPSARGGHESERLHTDTADWETPVDLISMLCVRADGAGGGRSRVLDVDAVRVEVSDRLGEATLGLLENEPVPWRLAAFCGGGVKWRPVLTRTGICWRRYTIDLALGAGGAELSPEMLGTLDAFEGVVAATARTHDFLLSEGELMFLDNTRAIHARTPVAGGGASDRLMIRSWIRVA
ncbi:MAG TPA: TauD/TfdA family dioxygenase [Pyrinomonadaceae bacterium]